MCLWSKSPLVFGAWCLSWKTQQIVSRLKVHSCRCGSSLAPSGNFCSSGKQSAFLKKLSCACAFRHWCKLWSWHHSFLPADEVASRGNFPSAALSQYRHGSPLESCFFSDFFSPQIWQHHCFNLIQPMSAALHRLTVKRSRNTSSVWARYM